MKLIHPEGVEYFYFTKIDGLPPETFAGLDVFAMPTLATWRHVLQPNMSDFRLVLAPWPLGPRLKARTAIPLFYLHWSGQVDLDMLDQKVSENTFSDTDFENSVQTQFGRTMCFNCKWEGYTLHAPPAQPYFGAHIGMFELERQKLDACHAHGGFKYCPVCGTHFTQAVVKIF